MGTIEQAAKRLEQLKQAGVEVNTGAAPADVVPSTGPAPEPLPLRVTKELEARPASVVGEIAGESLVTRVPSASATAAAAVAEALGARPRPSRGHVEIDLARLSASGYITPQAPRSRLAEEFRVIKRPLLTNVRGKPAAPVLNANRIMITSAVAGEGKTYVAVNLAMSLAMELDTHVLLVDADATRPAVFERLGLLPSDRKSVV